MTFYPERCNISPSWWGGGGMRARVCVNCRQRCVKIAKEGQGHKVYHLISMARKVTVKGNSILGKE